MLIALGRGPKSDPFLADDFYIVLILVWKAELIKHCSVCFGDKSYLFVKSQTKFKKQFSWGLNTSHEFFDPVASKDSALIVYRNSGKTGTKFESCGRNFLLVFRIELLRIQISN